MNVPLTKMIGLCSEKYVEEATRLRVDSHLAFRVGCRAYVDQIASVREAPKLLPGPVMGSTQRNRLRQTFAVRRFD